MAFDRTRNLRCRAVVKRIVLLVLYTAILIGISWCADHPELKHHLDAVKSLPGGDKLGHFLLVGGLTFILNWTLRCREFHFARGRLLLGSAIVFVLFTIDEFTQIWRPARSFDLGDLFANYAGVLCFGVLARVVVGGEKSTQAPPPETPGS